MRSIRSRSSSRRRWRSKPVQLVAVDRRPLLAVLGRRLGAGGEARACGGSAARRRRPRRSPRPRPKAAIASRARSRSASSSPASIASRICSRSSSMSIRSLPSPTASPSPPRLAALGDPALDRLGLGGAEEVAVEEQLEDAAVVLGLGDRRRQRLAEVVAARSSRPCSSAAKASRISEVPTATPSPRSSSQKPSSFAASPGRAGVGLGPVGRGGAHRPDNRRVSGAGSGQDRCARRLRENCARRGAAASSQQLDVMEVLYRVYLGGDLRRDRPRAVLAGAVHEAPADAGRDRRDLRRTGRPCSGSSLALAVLAGLRSGARGGPLAIEAAEVQYVLLAPVDRGAGAASGGAAAAADRASSPAPCSAPSSATSSSAACPARRSSGSPAWPLFGAAASRSACSAPRCSPRGRRLRPLAARRSALVLLAWSAADLAARLRPPRRRRCSATSATLPLQGGASAGAGGARRRRSRWPCSRRACSASAASPLEAARRRAALTAELRFSASVQDLRTVDPPAPPARLRAAAPATLAATPRSAAPRATRSGGAAGRASCAGRSVADRPRRSLIGGRRRRRSRPAAWSGAPLALRPARAAAASSPRSTWSSRSPRSPTTRPGASCCRSRRRLADPPPPRRAGCAAMAVGAGDRRRRRRRSRSAARRPSRSASAPSMLRSRLALRAGLLRRRQRHQRPLRLRPRPAARLRRSRRRRSWSPLVAVGVPAPGRAGSGRHGGSAPVGGALGVELGLLLDRASALASVARAADGRRERAVAA